jgi:replicative superfamily II helicase
MPHSEYSFQDFIAYLMIFAANSDLEFTDDEKEYIIKKVGRFEYEKMLTLFESHNDYESIEFILELKKVYVDEEGHDDMMSLLKKVFFTDNEFSTLEQGVFLALQRFK